MSLRSFFRNQKWPAWAEDGIALLGLIYYAAQSVLFAHTTISNLDEGGYLYKGLLFAEGVYRPFQPYGFWTNKMPLAFLIPGYVQVIFGAGLRTGRYLAVFEGILAVIAVWIAGRRMGGKWLAAGAVWTMALGLAAIKVNSVGATQSLVACLLAWTLALTLGGKRPLWQLLLASALASVTILARQNMIFVLPILLLYILWEYGWKAGIWSSLVGTAVFVLGHAVYWPDVLQIWVGWLPVRPTEWNQFLPPTKETITLWDPSIDAAGRLLSVFQGFRWHFVVLTGSLFSLFLWPKAGKWKDAALFRAAVFLVVLFFSLSLLHAYASLDKGYCVFCLAPYLSFFNVAGLLLVVVVLKSWNSTPSVITQAALVALVLLIAAGTGYATFEDSGKWLTALPVPRVKEGQILSGFTTLGELLFNKFALEQSAARKVSALGAGILIGVVFIAATFLAHILRLKRKYNYGYLLANTFLIAGFVVSPFLQGSQGAPDCRMDVIAANEEIGAYLAEVIPPESKVYWNGGLSVVPLLYAPQALIYPPQVNDGYSYKVGGNADAMLRYGLWNDELARQWREEADIIILEEWRYAGWKTFLSPDKFEEFPRTPVGTSCLENTRLRIFKRIK